VAGRFLPAYRGCNANYIKGNAPTPSANEAHKVYGLATRKLILQLLHGCRTAPHQHVGPGRRQHIRDGSTQLTMLSAVHVAKSYRTQHSRQGTSETAWASLGEFIVALEDIARECRIAHDQTQSRYLP
jgi:hypothetical protein